MSTINTILIKRRLESSGLNSIPTLSGGELAYSEKNHTLYYGGQFGTLTIAGSGAFVDVLNTQTISGPKTFTNTTTISGLTVSGSSTLDFGSNVLTNIGTPLNNTDAATKLYVDSVASGATSSTTALSSHVDTYFVEKIESDAVVLNGGLTVANDLSANAIFTTGNGSIGGNLRVAGNLEVLGDTTVIETTTTTTSSFQVTNYGTDTALIVTQVDGSNDIAEFKDGIDTALIVKGDGYVGVGTANPNERLTVYGNISASGSIYSAGGMLVDGGGANTTFYVEDGKVGINTETPNEALTVFGNISASQNIYAANGDFTGTLDADGATTLGSTLYVTNAATFASSVSAAGALTVDGSATFNADATVVDKLQVQSSDYDSINSVGTHVEIEGSNVKVVNDVQSANTTYGVDGITADVLAGHYTIATTNMNVGPGQGMDIVINSNGGLNDIALTGANVNVNGNVVLTGTSSLDNGLITTDGAGTITGTAGTSQLVDFVIDGGDF